MSSRAKIFSGTVNDLRFLEIRRYACTWWVYTSRGSSVTWNTGLWILVRYYARYVSEPPVALDFGTINGIHVRWIHTSMARRFASNVNELIYVDVSYIVVQVGRLEFRNLSSEEFCRCIDFFSPPLSLAIILLTFSTLLMITCNISLRFIIHFIFDFSSINSLETVTEFSLVVLFLYK